VSPLGAERLGELPFFRGLPAAAVETLAAQAHERDYAPGALVMRQHDEATHVYFLLQGTLQVLVHFEGVGDLLMGVLRRPGTMEGWSAFRPPYRATASLRCEEECRVAVIPREAFEALIDRDPATGYEILKRVAIALDARLESALGFLEDPAREAW
jgi:CRP-like cAMP-binding protein